ncbi:ABC transporter permease [Pseudonocardia eucalypti]|uniref:ABC transporter permease n=1 Tax=Pseudonocardia eucalypti TaxID=648755 RepID=A0ABP9PFK4_9PSEU|nr:osmoprotectant transport system permease protein [Pseudonocardia eucalypti]
MGFAEYVAGNWPELLAATLEHAVLVLVSLALATAICIPLAVVTYRTDLPRGVVLAAAGVFLTIPSYALFGLLIAPLGLGATPAVVALTLYAMLPILRNAIVGLRNVNPAVSESAIGMGMDANLRLRRVDLPLAWPVIVTGMRVSAQLLLGIAAIAATVGGPGLGRLILTGLDVAGTPFAIYLTLEGILGIIVLALLFDLAFVLLSRLTTSRGLR